MFTRGKVSSNFKVKFDLHDWLSPKVKFIWFIHLLANIASRVSAWGYLSWLSPHRTHFSVAPHFKIDEGTSRPDLCVVQHAESRKLKHVETINIFRVSNMSTIWKLTILLLSGSPFTTRPTNTAGLLSHMAEVLTDYVTWSFSTAHQERAGSAVFIMSPWHAKKSPMKSHPCIIINWVKHLNTIYLLFTKMLSKYLFVLFSIFSGPYNVVM